jgi:hypothetical protein
MKKANNWLTRNTRVMAYGLAITTLLALSCDSDDPKAVNEEELITTLQVDLFTSGNTAVYATLKFYDEDGNGSIPPVYTQTGSPIYANSTYTTQISLLNEQETPAEDITLEIEEEKNDHIFCFTRTGSIASMVAIDEDDNELPVGLLSTLTTGTAGAGTVTIILRHQPEVKTGVCPGAGDTDIEVTFSITVVAEPL